MKFTVHPLERAHTFRFSAGHQLELLLLGGVAAILGQLLQNVSPGVHGDVQVMRESRAIAAGAREGVLLARLLVGVDEREDGVQVRVGVLADLLDQFRVVDGVDGDVVAGFVAHLGAFDVELYVHARAAAAFVQFAIDEDFRQEGIFGVVRTAIF